MDTASWSVSVWTYFKGRLDHWSLPVATASFVSLFHFRIFVSFLDYVQWRRSNRRGQSIVENMCVVDTFEGKVGSLESSPGYNVLRLSISLQNLRVLSGLRVVQEVQQTWTQHRVV